jgi:hypothetical protein
MASYDGTLQMFVHAPKDVDMRRLVFMRWLAEHGKLEHAIAGASSGPLAASAEAAPTSPFSAVA